MRVRSIRSHGLVPLRFSRFVVLFFCRLHVLAWRSGYEKSNRDRSLRAPVKGDPNIAIRNEFRRCALELSSVSPRCRLRRRSKERTSCFRSPQVPTAFLVSFPNRGADTGLTTTSWSSRPRVLRSALRRSRRVRVSFSAEFPPWKRASTVHHRLLQLILDARARPELPLPPSLTTTFLAERRLAFHPRRVRRTAAEPR